MDNQTRSLIVTASMGAAGVLLGTAIAAVMYPKFKLVIERFIEKVFDPMFDNFHANTMMEAHHYGESVDRS